MSYSRTKVKLTINDNWQGCGLPVRLSELAVQGKLGLLGIEERASLFGGTFSIRSQPKKGTKISVALPVSTKPKNLGRDR